MKQYVSKYAKCPYYRKEEQTKIYCEGFLAENSLQMVFTDEKICRAYKHNRCQQIDGYDLCPVAVMLTEEYELRHGKEADC